MTKNLNEQKAKLKESLGKEVDRYFEAFENSSVQEGFDINAIEKLMGENQRKVKEALNEATSELAENVDAGKKNCPNCGNSLKKPKINQPLQVKTMYGELRILRDYCYCRGCGYSEVPLDKTLGLTELPHKMTREMMLEVAFYGQNQSSFADASAMIERALGMEINKETVREITESVGKRVFEADTLKAEHLISNMHEIEAREEKDGRTLYIMTDGAAVNTRVEDENGSTWRENKTVIVFTNKDMIKRKDGGNIIINKEYAAFIGSAEEFRGYVLSAAVNAGYGKVSEVVIIADGATWIRNMARELFPEATQILDLYHLKENIYTYAKHKFSQNEKEYTPWAEAVIAKIENGNADEVLKQLPEDEKLPTGVVNLRTYMTNNIDKINYPEYKSKGYFVGSGAIESANKVVVQRRLKQAGMRWSVDGAQAVLTLRAKVESKLWDRDVRALCA